MYSFKIHPEEIHELYRLREFAGKGPISRQARNAIKAYIKKHRVELARITEIESEESK